MRAERVLVSASDSTLRAELRQALGDLAITEATDELTTAALAAACRPSVVVIDGSDAASTRRTIEALKRDLRTAFLPRLFVLTDPAGAERIGESFGGADDYVLYPFEPGDLRTRVRVALRRSGVLRGLSPLTGLPGNAAVSDEMERRLDGHDPFACLYVDLDEFKSFNDRHGFAKGDEAILAVAQCVLLALEEESPIDAFAGHLGGDDYVVLCPQAVAEAVADGIITCFDKESWGCSMSVGVVMNAHELSGPIEIAEAAARAKGEAKARSGSARVVHRR